MKDRKFFYTGIANISEISKIEILVESDQENTSSVAGKYIYKDLTFGFIDIYSNNNSPSVFTNILKFSFSIQVKKKNLSEFNRLLSRLVNQELKDIPTVQAKYEYSSKDGMVFFELTNQVAYSSEISNSDNIILPMLEFLLGARALVTLFVLKFKQDHNEG